MFDEPMSISIFMGLAISLVGFWNFATSGNTTKQA
jgi:hypothetical protein